MRLGTKLKTLLKVAGVPLIYRSPPFNLAPERLATYLSALLERTHVRGDVAEVGCHLGGTAAIAGRMLARLQWPGTYICYDTFGGFVGEQFDFDVQLGTPAAHRELFMANSAKLVRKILDYHGAHDVQLVKGDITKLPERDLSASYSVVLLDIDLSEPTYLALQRFWPRLASGGIILVDDCPERNSWKARAGYTRFCDEAGIEPQYRYGMGILEKGPAPAS